jgi:hypothetical protein
MAVHPPIGGRALARGPSTHQLARALVRGLMTTPPLAMTRCTALPSPRCTESPAAGASLGAGQKRETGKSEE